MKFLILTVIVLVIPGFFVFVFAMSAASRLKNLRNRCLEIRSRLDAAPAAEQGLQLREEFNAVAREYNLTRRKFPGYIVATLGGFGELKSLELG